MLPPRGKLETVEAARGIAALAVVLFHANAAAKHIGHRTLDALAVGEHGVDFFFVLSGFIIFHVHRRDIGQPRQAGEYLLKRFIRLFPLLWIVVGFAIFGKIAMGSIPQPSAIGTSLLLYPSLEAPIPLVVWTLRHEILFYLAFLVLIASRGLGLALFGGWTIACIVQLLLAVAGSPVKGLGSFLLSTYQLDFVLGAMVALLHSRRIFRPSLRPLWVGLAMVAAVLAVDGMLGIHRRNLLEYTSWAATVWTLILGAAFAVLLHGLLIAEGRVRVPRAAVVFGAASYAIYLVHTPLNSITQRLVAGLPSGATQIAIFLIGSLAGLVLHLSIEKPLTKRLRRVLLTPGFRTPALPGGPAHRVLSIPEVGEQSRDL